MSSNECFRKQNRIIELSKCSVNSGYSFHPCTPGIWLMRCVCGFLTILVQCQQGARDHRLSDKVLSIALSNTLSSLSWSYCVQPCGINAQHITTALSLHLILSGEFLQRLPHRIDEIYNCAPIVQRYQPHLSITNQALKGSVIGPVNDIFSMGCSSPIALL